MSEDSGSANSLSNRPAELTPRGRFGVWQGAVCGALIATCLLAIRIHRAWIDNPVDRNLVVLFVPIHLIVEGILGALLGVISVAILRVLRRCFLAVTSNDRP